MTDQLFVVRLSIETLGAVETPYASVAEALRDKYLRLQFADAVVNSWSIHAGGETVTSGGGVGWVAFRQHLESRAPTLLRRIP